MQGQDAGARGGLRAAVNQFGGSSGRGIKPLLNKLGLPGGTLRAPRIAISDAEAEQMLNAYAALKLPFAPMLP